MASATTLGCSHVQAERGCRSVHSLVAMSRTIGPSAATKVIVVSPVFGSKTASGSQVHLVEAVLETPTPRP